VTHVRTQIRNLAVSTATGLSLTGSNVFESRLHPLAQSQLPCWIVSADEEEGENVTMAMGGAPEQQRTLQLEFAGYARGVSGVEDTLDSMAEELEAVITTSAFAALAKDIEYQGTEVELAGEDLDNTFGIVTVVYRVTYHTTAGAPGTAV